MCRSGKWYSVVILLTKKISKTPQLILKVFKKSIKAFHCKLCCKQQWWRCNRGALLLPFHSLAGIGKAPPSPKAPFTGWFPKDSLTLARMYCNMCATAKVMGHQVAGATHTWFILLLTPKVAKNPTLKVKPKILIYKKSLKGVHVKCSNALCLKISSLSRFCQEWQSGLHWEIGCCNMNATDASEMQIPFCCTSKENRWEKACSLPVIYAWSC